VRTVNNGDSGAARSSRRGATYGLPSSFLSPASRAAITNLNLLIPLLSQINDFISVKRIRIQVSKEQ
jgi:hypothetical protein